MKRFKFRLERIRNYRITLRKEKERELAIANAELIDKQSELERILQLQNETPAAPEGQLTMAELVILGDYSAMLQESLENQRELVEAASEAVEKAREAYIEKAVEAETLETLKDKKIEEYRQERRKQERKESDALTVSRFGR